MSQTPDRDRLADRRFAERLAEHYRPEPLGPAQRARFDASLRERIEHRWRGPAGLAPLAGAVAALSLAWWIWLAASPATDSETGGATGAMASSMTISDWEADVLLADVLLADADATLAGEEDYLPDEYVALAVAFLDGR